MAAGYKPVKYEGEKRGLSYSRPKEFLYRSVFVYIIFYRKWCYWTPLAYWTFYFILKSPRGSYVQYLKNSACSISKWVNTGIGIKINLYLCFNWSRSRYSNRLILDGKLFFYAPFFRVIIIYSGADVFYPT